MAEKTNDNNNQPTFGDNNQIVIYTTSDGKVNLEVQIDANTVWLTQQQIAQLYGKAVSTINEHIKNILAEEEQKEDECVKKFGNSEFQQKAPTARCKTCQHLLVSSQRTPPQGRCRPTSYKM